MRVAKESQLLTSHIFWRTCLLLSLKYDSVRRGGTSSQGPGNTFHTGTVSVGTPESEMGYSAVQELKGQNQGLYLP
jgi:hypothetical protein